MVIPTSFVDGGTKNPEFLRKNPNGQVPLLELDDGRRIAESNAIMLYLEEQQLELQRGKGVDSSPPCLIPRDAYQRATMYQWMFFEQYSHEPAIAVRRANVVFQRPCSEEKMQQLLDKGYWALGVMEEQLAKTPFMVGEDMTLADISLYAYTHVADEGGYDMSKYANVKSWLQRVKASEGFWGMDILGS
ncbi:MAG: hypothetical protein SGILL_003613 [Bacillariaceae sp.]